MAVIGLPLRAVQSAFAAPTDYLVDTWDTENGLPSSTVTAISQTPDGYLWVGTYAGLARFDGVRFVTFDPANTPALSQSRVQGLFLDANGILWINTFRGGLTAYRNGVFHNERPDQAGYDLHTTLVASTTNNVIFVTQSGEVLRRNPMEPGTNWMVTPPPDGSLPVFQCVDGKGRLWFLTQAGHIMRFGYGSFRNLADDGGLAGKRIYTLAADAQGRVWAGAENEIARWDGEQFELMTPTNGEANVRPFQLYPTKAGAIWVLDGERFREMIGRKWVAEAVAWRGLLESASSHETGAHEDRAGGMWFNHYFNGLFHITPEGQYQRLTTQNGLPSDSVVAWFQDHDGGIWIGMEYGGLAHLRERRFDVIGTAEGLTARTALSVCEDSQGKVWIGTSGGGLCCWDGKRIASYPVGSSASANFVFSVFPRTDGGLWLSAAEGEDLYQFQDGVMQRAAWDVHGIKSILADHAGRLWLGTKTGIAIWAGNDRRMFGAGGNAMSSAVRALAETPDGTVWAGADDGTLYRCRTNGLDAFPSARRTGGAADLFPLRGRGWHPLGGNVSGRIAAVSEGSLPANHRQTGFAGGCDLPDSWRMAPGGSGSARTRALYCVSKKELNDCADGRIQSVDYMTYGRHDGLPTLEFSERYQPACWRGTDGRLWFTTTRGVVSVNPNKPVATSLAPPVHIEEMLVDGEPVALRGSKIIVPPGHQQFDFVFTALNFDSGEKTRFRYQIDSDGSKGEWVYAGTQRSAHYGPLPPGTYHFRVTACDDEGEWNDANVADVGLHRPTSYLSDRLVLVTRRSRGRWGRGGCRAPNRRGKIPPATGATGAAECHRTRPRPYCQGHS